MHVGIKICCIKSPVEAKLALAAGADAVGVVGAFPPNPRAIPDPEIAAIAITLPAQVRAFLLSSASTADGIAAQIARTRVNAVQILDHLSAAESERLAHIMPQIWRVQVVHVEGPHALDLIPMYAPFADAFLLDSGKPNAAVKQFGGTGQVHDWGVSAEFVRRSAKPTYLAGGLNADNVASAIRAVQPAGVDVCSGVRTEGHLDTAKLIRFVDSVRSA